MHGYPLDRSIWREQIGALEGFRRIAPDLRGMGQSDAPDLGYSMSIYAADLAALLDVLGVDDVVLCGLLDGRLRRVRVPAAVALQGPGAGADGHPGRGGRPGGTPGPRCSGGHGTGARRRCHCRFDASQDAGSGDAQPPARSGRAACVHSWPGTPVAGLVGALAAMRDREESESLLPTLAGVPTLVIVGEGDT